MGNLKGTSDQIDVKRVGSEGTACCPEVTLCIQERIDGLWRGEGGSVVLV